MRFRLANVGIFFLFLISFHQLIIYIKWWKTNSSSKSIISINPRLNFLNQVTTTKVLKTSEPILSSNNSWSYIVFDPNTWIINNLVAHYGSKLILFSNDDLLIEALAFFDTTRQSESYIKSAFKCLLNLNEKTHKVSIIEAISLETWINVQGRRFLWRIR